jgi:hypothetical protein
MQTKMNWQRRYCLCFCISLKKVLQYLIFSVLNIYKEKHKMRGRNKISAKLRRKQKNVIDSQQLKLKEMQKLQREAKQAEYAEKLKSQTPDAGEQPKVSTKHNRGAALSRFFKKEKAADPHL